MFKPNKREIKILGIILIVCIISAFGGYYIAWATNGSNLTIDEAKGIYNAPWFNATVGVKAPRIEVEEFYINSNNRTILLSGQNATGATAYVGFDANLDYLPNYWYCDGVADDVQIQTAINYGNYVYLEEGNYSISSNIEINGTGSLISKKIIQGAGWFTHLIGASNVDVFEFNDGACVEIRDLTIETPSISAGRGIYGSDDGVTRDYSVIFSIFENLLIHGGSQDSWMVYLQNPNFFVFRDCYIRHDNGVGTVDVSDGEPSCGALKLECTSSIYAYCDGSLEGNTALRVEGANKTGLLIKGNSNKGFQHLKSNGNICIYATPSTGTCGIYAIYARYNKFRGLHFENQEEIISLHSNSQNNLFEGEYIKGSVGSTIFKIADNDCYMNVFDGYKVELGNLVLTFMNNSVTASTYGQILKNMLIDQNGNAANVWGDIWFEPDGKLGVIGGGAIPWITQYEGTQSVTGAVNSVVVSHSLIATPDFVWVCPLTSGIGEWYVNTKNATTFTINFANQPNAGTWSFDWTAHTR